MDLLRPLSRRVAFVPQMEATECAPACLAMVLRYHDAHVPLAELREACAVSRDGCSARDIVAAARRYGLEPTALKVELEDLPDVVLPAILHWELNHFVVLERVGRDGAEIVDPAVGTRRVSNEELARSFTGVVIALERGTGFVRRRRAGHGRSAYQELLRKAGRPVLVMTASALLLEVFALLFPAASALVVDFVIRPRQAQWIPILAVAFAVAIALRAAITLARERILVGLEVRIDVELATSLVKHLLSLPVAFFSQRGAGDLLNRVGALLAARDLFARVLLAGFDVILVAVYAALMVLYDPRIGGGVVLVHLLNAIVTNLARPGIRAAFTARVVAAGRAQSALVQAFADPESAKAFGAETLLAAQYATARIEELNASVRAQRSLELSRQSLNITQGLATALVLWLGGRAVLEDRMTLGVLTSLLTIQTLLGPPLQRLLAALGELGNVGPLLDRADDVLETMPEASGSYVPDIVEGAITFENVCFRYGQRGALLLHDVSFHIAAGERVAIAGVSGAGKSTIVKLALGFMHPTSGRILLDGRDLRDYDLEALRARIGTVVAGGALFDETLFDNVTIGVPDATPALVRGALEAACVTELVQGLPRGVLTRLGPGASRLSGGQRQRLLLGRALVKQPSLLLLDEASSALDAQLERRVQAYLAQLRCTMIVVSHRLSSIGFADRVLYLDGGRIVQEGSFAALTRVPGPVRELLRAHGGLP